MISDKHYKARFLHYYSHRFKHVTRLVMEVTVHSLVLEFYCYYVVATMAQQSLGPKIEIEIINESRMILYGMQKYGTTTSDACRF